MHGNLIAGRWVPAVSQATFQRRNPADTADLVGEFPDSGPADAAAAVDSVAAGYREWADYPPDKRAAVLERAAAVLESRQDAIARELVREEGKTLAEATFEASRTPANLRMFAGEALRLSGQSLTAAGDGLVVTVRQPAGVVAVITPWNFPLNIPSRKLGPALAAGNGVVFKPSETTPLTGQRLAEALLDAGLPPGALALVQGGPAAGQAIVSDPRVAAVTFTGSCRAGEAIHRAAGPARRCQLEMGGKNPVIVLADSDLDRAAAIIVKGAFGLTGQACTGTSRVIAHDAVHDELVSRVAKAIAGWRIGSGLDPETRIGPLATEAQLAKFLGYVQAGRDEGARLVTGGERLTGPGYDRGYFVTPAVFEGLRPGMRITREEVFGPLLGFQRAASAEEAIELANGTGYGLAAGIVTSDIGQALRFASRVQAGVVKVNQPTTGVAMNAPFGGLKNSSTQTFKEQAGETMLHFYTSEKTVYLSG